MKRFRGRLPNVFFLFAVVGALGVLVPGQAAGRSPNLFPNGGVENEFVNRLSDDDHHRTRIQPRGSGVPTFWHFSSGVSRTRGEKAAGEASLILVGGSDDRFATVFTDFWKAKDPSYPFGTPLLPGRPVHLSFFYKTSGHLAEGSLKASLRLGAIDHLASETREWVLSPCREGCRIEKTLTPRQLLWRAELTFSLAGQSDEEVRVRIDEVVLTQDLPPLRNLVHNPGFESVEQTTMSVADWEPPVEDEWVSWVGKRYRPTTLDSGDAHSGSRSARASVTYAEISGLSQVIHLDQDRPRPVILGVWSKLDNSIGKGPPGYYGSDNLANLILYVHFQDGTMQEVSPTFCLGESDHDWDFRRGGFLPLKPVDFVRLQFTVVGTEPTTSLWVDELEVFELGEENESLPSDKFAPPKTVFSRFKESLPPLLDRVTVVNDQQRLFLSIPFRPGEESVECVLNPRSEAPFPTHQRYLYPVIRVSDDGTAEIGRAVDKQGYVKTGLFQSGKEQGIHSEKRDRNGVGLSIPWSSLGLSAPPSHPIGLNLRWKTAQGVRYWNGKSLAVAHLGRLIPSPPLHPVIRSLRFGDRWDQMSDQSQDWVTHPPIYFGKNRATVELFNPTKETGCLLSVGIEGEPSSHKTELPAGMTRAVTLEYETGEPGIRRFRIDLESEGETILSTAFPLSIPQPVEIVLSQEYYYDRETEGTAEVHIRYRPFPGEARLVLEIEDRENGETFYSSVNRIEEATSVLSFPLDGIRTNPLPVQDYEVRVSLFAGKTRVGSATAAFGRIHPTQRAPLPPIEKVDVDERGMLVLNDHFRFFPIVPSLVREERLEAIRLGANINRGIYKARKEAAEGEPDIFDDTEATWKLGAYTLPVGPGPQAMEAFREEAGELLDQPGFLGCYPKQFYYWNLPPEYEDYRREVEKIFASHPKPKLIVWGHHDSSLLYDLEHPDWPDRHPTVGYCYVKIMSRPGSAWRNAPLLTRTEQILNPHRFKLAEVNGYVAWSNDEITPEHFMTYFSLRADDIAGMRNEAYLAVIYGANGLYQYLCHQPGELQRYRGWFQELNFMWPIFVADDSDIPVQVEPIDSGIETRLKKSNGRYYLLTANASEARQSAYIRLKGVEGMEVKKLFDLQGELKVRGGTIEDVWSEKDVFVYEVAIPEHP